jgi:uridylate kinase
VEPGGEAGPRYRRVLLKLSGEALSGEKGTGIDSTAVHDIAAKVGSACELGVQLAIVVGGGNMIRGARVAQEGTDQATADYMGMMATVINALALQLAIEQTGVATRVQSAIAVHAVAEPFVRRRAIRHLEKGRLVILAAGTGHPFFTTDTAAALRALELGADALFKATKVDGVYDKDPVTHPDARRYEYLRYDEAIERRLAVMDQTAFTMCREHGLPIIVFALHAEDSIRRALRGEPIGTTVGGAEDD